MNRAESLYFEGNRHLSADDLAAAEACFLDAIALEPDFVEAHVNLGWVCERTGRVDAAELHYRLAIRLDPACGQAQLNLGALLAVQQRFDEAEDAYRQALSVMPDSPAAWSNLGVLQTCRKQEELAEQSFRRALSLDPDHRLASFNLGYLLLRQGRFEEGWQRLEARDWYARLERALPFPRWQGEPLAGRSLLVGFEAGHGDMIQFCRYCALLKAQGAGRIDVICHPALKTLFGSLKGVGTVSGFDEPLPSIDWNFWTPPLSMPYHCKTRAESIPAAIPYLYAPPERVDTWSARLALHTRNGEIRVGLVWRGNPRFENDDQRSLPGLATLAPLAGIPGVRYFSLQKGKGEEEAVDPPDGFLIVDLAEGISDFADSAAIISNLDLVVSVDTAVVHLAGALGKPCWVLLPGYKTDWRWQKDRSDSPWYPGVMRLFRQARDGDWGPVIEQVRAELVRLAAAR